MKLLKKILTILLCVAAMLVTVFMVGRYGWKLGGFNACFYEMVGTLLAEFVL